MLWTTNDFIEEEGVPSDAEVVGHTWRFVNKSGGPDRRFNNNRQIPKVLYLQMRLRSSEGLRKVLYFSRVVDHVGFDAALDSLRRKIRELQMIPVESVEASSGDRVAEPKLLGCLGKLVVDETARQIAA